MMYRQSVRVNNAVKKKLTCCQKLSKRWILALNTVVGLIGGFLLGFTLTNSIQQGDAIEALGENGLVGAAIAAGFLIFASVLGCCGVVYKNKFMLILYLLLTLALSGAFIGVGVLFLFLVDDLGNIDGENADTLGGTVEGRLNDALIAIFNECCGENFDFDKLLGCGEDGANLDACFTFEETYEAALDRIRTTGLCDTFENTFVEVDVGGGVIIEVPVVGSLEEGGCAGGDGVVFKAILTDQFEELLEPLGVVFLVTGIMLFVANIATCVLLCATQDDEEVEAALKSDRAAKSMMHTVPPPTEANRYAPFEAANPQYGSSKNVYGGRNY